MGVRRHLFLRQRNNSMCVLGASGELEVQGREGEHRSVLEQLSGVTGGSGLGRGGGDWSQTS